MKERDRQSPEQIAEALKPILDSASESKRLEVIWDPSIADSQIHLTDKELDEFIQTFSDDKRGRDLQEWIVMGTQCEIVKEINGKFVRDGKNAVCSIDFDANWNSESTLVCRDDLRPAYADFMLKNVQGKKPITLRVRINGKEVPKPER